ncbi:hypothetical protein CJ030_MR1G005683 [Morella rubra]|uniref:Hyaluronan/mRNA-binding protein domain-containing protein n=1 Tax=Morella rubra TaxID=262757 RepID=A0A6A1WMS7_9ROSI|nr:hypothetical protein CJ030_MR1G005683 [Morella rubra]
MATMNPFDLLGDDDAEDPSQLIAAQQKVAAAAAAAQPKKVAPAAQVKLAAEQQQTKPPPKLPSKPLPPAQAGKLSDSEARNDGVRGGGRAGGRGYGRGRGGGGFNREPAEGGDSGRFIERRGYESSFSNSGVPTGQGAPEEGDSGRSTERRGYVGPRSPYRGGRRGGFSNGDDGDGERPRRAFERRSGTGRGNEFKREGSGRGNWGTQTDEIVATEEVVNETEKNVGDEKPVVDEEPADSNKETPANEAEEKEPEDKSSSFLEYLMALMRLQTNSVFYYEWDFFCLLEDEMTLEEYEKLLEEKRKALQGLKTEERKVDAKEFETMQQLSSKKGSDDIFIKLGSEKDKRREAFEKEERAKKVGDVNYLFYLCFATNVVMSPTKTMGSKKSVSINEFLKPAEGERFNSGGRGRGRGRGSRGGYGGNAYASSNVSAPSIEDQSQFPTLGAK